MPARAALLILVLVAGPAVAAPDKPRLRKLATMPTVSVVAGIGFSTTYGLTFNEDKPDPLAEIARLPKEMKGDAGDVVYYQRLGLFYPECYT